MMRRLNWLWLLVAAGCCLPPAHLPAAAPVAIDAVAAVFRTNKLAEIDAAMEQAVADKKLPGGVVWLERAGTAYPRAYGKRSLTPTTEAMTEDTIFDAASLTKVLATAPAVMWLIEHGQLRLDERVAAYLPEFAPHGKESITLRHLLTHTSGLRPGLSRTPAWSGYATAIAKACEESVTSAPGTAFRYSDINFIVLGEVVRRVSGRSLADFVRERFYRPLRMNDTCYLPPAALMPRVAPTEKVDGRILRGQVHDPTARAMGGVAGHAGVFTTAADLARFARMILNAGELEGARVLAPETVHLMTTVQSPATVPIRRGLGWDIDSAYAGPRGKCYPVGSFGHSGWTGTSLWIDPASRSFIILLSNRNHPTEAGNVLPLRVQLGTLAAEALVGCNYSPATGVWPPGQTNGPSPTPPPAPSQKP